MRAQPLDIHSASTKSEDRREAGAI